MRAEIKRIVDELRDMYERNRDRNMDGVDQLIVLELIEDVHREIEALRNAGTIPANPLGQTDEQLQKRADYNRDNAATLFPELFESRGEWYTIVPLNKMPEKVIFTPHGYLTESQMNK